MPIIKANISPDDLLQAVLQLNERELDTFMAQVIAFQAQRKAPHLSQEEATLLQQINTPLPSEIQKRYNELIALRRAEKLTPEEHDELIRLGNQVETFQTQRVSSLAQLARLRDKTLAEVLADLGIKTPVKEPLY